MLRYTYIACVVVYKFWITFYVLFLELGPFIIPCLDSKSSVNFKMWTASVSAEVCFPVISTFGETAMACSCTNLYLCSYVHFSHSSQVQYRRSARFN
jgi:hypothetical protein